MRSLGLLLFLIISLLALGLATDGSQHVRKKRQIMQDQPRLLTENGNLVFQCGNNKNINFRPAPGGNVYIGSDNLTYIAELAKGNRDEIQRLKSSTDTPSSIDTRLNSLEGSVTSLQTLPGQLQTLTSNFNQVKTTVQQTNANNRLQTVESRLNNLRPTGQVQTSLNSLDSRLTTLENRVTSLDSTVGTNDNSGLRHRVQTLETTVQRLQQLLTTNECQSNPCQNGGTCVDSYNSFFCQCPDNYQGATCSADVNECSEFAGTDRGCQNGATCVNLQGSFRCDCAPNWYGILCTSAVNDCSGATHQALCGHGTCVNAPNTHAGRANYRCICQSGWTTSNTSSDPACDTDINECLNAHSACSADPPVQCINTPGSFTCGTCPAGYQGNGFTCSDVNECETNNGGCSLSPRVDCVNTRGSRQCGPCPAGYQGNGVTCTYVGVCHVNNGGCHSLATCSEQSGVVGVTCTCPTGYVGSGVGPNGCASSGSGSGACANNPCQHGTCTPSGNSYSCACNAGYTGVNCNTDVNECNNNPCRNGGTCVNSVGSYTCQCTADFTGPTCEQEQQGCGGYLNTPQGRLSYPRVQGQNYTHGVSCAWQITTSSDKILSITFQRFNVEVHPQCNFDFLQIHDGPSASSHMIGKFCGGQLPNGGRINSTHNKLYLWFKSDASIASDGFNLTWTSQNPVCGGNLNNGTHGVINSPGYPGNYPHNRDCAWVVSVPVGNNIMFTFASLAIEHHSNCSYDYLELRSGMESNAPLLNRYCGTSSSVPAPVTTVGPYAYVYFHTDSSLSDHGFHITYAAVDAGSGCGGALTGADGTVMSPNYPGNYDHRAECVWTITANSSDNIVLTFNAFNLEAGGGCPYDYLEIRNGVDETGSVLARLCGSQTPAVITSSGNQLFLKFRTDGSISGTGFSASWTTSCGGTFTQDQGMLQSPSFPNTYPHNKQCNYLINVPQGKRVVLNFLNFTIEGGSCTYDYVALYDGGTTQATVLGQRYCGASIPPMTRSTGNMMLLRFVTDASVSHMGFRANYTSEIAGCGGVIRGSQGNFTSPGHPNTYPHGVNCTWYIQAPPGLIIQLTFNTFLLEGGSCRYDYVEVFDGNLSENATRIGPKYCGRNTPPMVTSTNNYLTVSFQADGSVAYEGFTASFVTQNATTACGRTLHSETGVITSPGYPDNYPNTRNCTWIIITPANRQIRLNITTFRLESCPYDYLEIRNGGFSTSPLVGRFCGTTITSPLVSHSNTMWLRFVSDNSRAYSGFRIVYDGTATGCGGDLTTPTGSFISPNYPNPYTHNSECFWTIRGAQGSILQLTFQDLDVETHSQCRFDYLEIRENGPTGYQIGDRVCGTTIPSPVNTTASRMWIKYRTDSSVSGRGFSATYNINCRNRLTAHSGVIESINYPNTYHNNQNCSWLIAATAGNTVNISFQTFHLESGSGCNYDYLEILDGESPSSPSLGKFCDDNVPTPVTSTSNRVRVNFVTDSSVTYGGFRLQYVTNGCGGMLSGPSGNFTSLNYPNPYQHATTCEWTITVNTSYAISLTFHDFDMEGHHNCGYDAVEVYAGRDDTGPQLTKLCHSQTTAQVTQSTGNVIFVRMRTDRAISGRGFSASWTQIPGGCGGTYSTRNGIVMSKNYPSNYPHNTECEWLISLPVDHPIIFNITDFDIEGGSCVYDYLDLYDGPNTNSRRMAHLCGREIPGNSTYRASNNVMYVKMRTDSSVTGRGFKAQYYPGCGGVLNATTDGEVFSQNYPQNYPPASNCTWLITSVNSMDRITVTFTHLDIETSDGCRDDYLQVLNGNDDSSPVMGRYCGDTVPTPITSSGNNMFLFFHSDYTSQATGFRAVYTVSTSSCGGDFTASNGAFVSPSYPDSYPASTECVWTIRTSPGNLVAVAFSMFNLESSSACTNDYLEIREASSTGTLRGRFCGATMPTNLTAAASLWIKFRSDSQTTGQGFRASWNAVYGGYLNGDSGQITSPNYPQAYPRNVNYAWIVTVTSGRAVQLSFSFIDVEGSSQGSSCPYDGVRIRDGGLATSAVLGTYCGTDSPSTPIISTSNRVRVEFYTDRSVAGSGFALNWQAVAPSSAQPPTNGTASGCGGVLVAGHSTQYLQSPNYPNNYNNSLNCTWTISSTSGHRVWVNITDINLESHGSCYYDYVRIAEGGNIFGTFCGSEIPSPIMSTGSRLTVTFVTDGSVTRPGFRIAYKAACGGTLQGTQGIIRSPGYPSNYPANMNCTWSVNVPSGRTIVVRFNGTFSISGSSPCSGDYVQLLNGAQSTSPPLRPNGTSSTSNPSGKYCGTTAPAGMETSSNRLTVNFVTDASGNAPGFSLFYSQHTVTCGGQLTLTNSMRSGYFTSPNYPGNYPHRVECVWVITAPANERVQVDFDPNFAIEPHSRCSWDYIGFRDGATDTSPAMGKFCGSTPPGTVFSTGNALYARFRTDGSVDNVGFRANYQMATCGGRISGSNGTILSPNYPSNYDPNANCSWVISGPTGHYLSLTFNAFNLESSNGCSNDYVVVREFNQTGNVVLRPSCGSTVPASFDTSDSLAFVQFVSNGNAQASGFNLTFQASVEECGGDLTTSTGTIASPNYPGLYAHSRVCVWRITVPTGRRVKLTFNDFGLEGISSSRCFWDYVEVTNGIIARSPVMGRYCGNSTTPDPVQSSSNTMTVKFRTDGSVSNRGFRATYTSLEEAKCGGVISVPTNISSPGFYEHGNYSNSEQCIWLIQNPQRVNSSIKIVVNHLQLERHTRCSFDFLEFREGPSANSPLIEKFCGNNTLPPQVITPSDQVWVRFRTDGSVVDTGFDVSFSPTTCGGILDSPQGVLTSPNYPNNYDHDDFCVWKIVAPEGQRIRLQFTDFSLENHVNCRWDYLELFNGGMPDSPSVGRFCGQNVTSFLSQSNTIRVVFKTDFSAAARGFRATYSYDSEGCGGMYHSNTGNISSPNYPSNYPANTECVWNINVLPGYTVIFSVSALTLQNTANCGSDYLEITDVMSNGTQVSKGRYCGSTVPPVVVSNTRRLLVTFHSDGATSAAGFAANWTSSCGGTFTGGRGEIVSPGYPRAYTNNLRCNYTLLGEPQHYVMLSFDSSPYGLEVGSRNCQFDFIQVFAGNSSSGTQMGKFCGSTVPDPVYAIGALHVRFWTDSSVVRPGFKARYRIEECGGVFTQPYGHIRTPTYPNNYAHNSNCTWTITLNNTNVVALKFLSFDVESHSRCRYDYVAVYDGDSISSSNLIGRYCGSSVPSLITSRTNKMLVNFITDASVAKGGFSAGYWATYGEQHGCGGVINSTSGVLRSFDADGDGLYENNLNCGWTFFAGDGKVITFNLTGLNIEHGGPNCAYDYVAIYDGTSDDDPLLGKYCGDDTPPPAVTTSTNAAYVVFHTDGSVVRPGFNMTYTQQDSVCGGSLTATQAAQNLTSPGYPSAYGQGIRCRWTIDSGTQSKQVSLTLTDLDLANQTSCTGEYIELRDSPRGTNGQSIHYCGTRLPPTFDTIGRVVQVNYLSSASTGRGFRLSYAWADCNKQYSGTSGRITSPGYPGRYPRNARCNSTVTAPAGYTLAFYFTRFFIEAHSRCAWDYLAIRNGTNSSASEVARLCGAEIPDPVFLSSNTASLSFITDSSAQHLGYDITYVATTSGVLGCGGDIQAGINGSLTSPNFPGNFTSEDTTTCTWTITVPARRQLRLNFTYLAVPGQADCAHNYVEVFNGPTVLSPTFGQFCTTMPATLRPSGNTATVKLTSTASSPAPSFRIVYYS